MQILELHDCASYGVIRLYFEGDSYKIKAINEDGVNTVAESGNWLNILTAFREIINNVLNDFETKPPEIKPTIDGKIDPDDEATRKLNELEKLLGP